MRPTASACSAVRRRYDQSDDADRRVGQTEPGSVKAMNTTENGRTFLRHTLATLAYRGGKALRGTPPSFGAVRAAEGCRSASEILAHIGDLLDWALVYAREGRHEWHDRPP